jgi:predicted branched-subunit amino acid permease
VDGPAAPLDIARLFCLRIQTLGIIWLLTDDPRYRDRAKAELLAVCSFPNWRGDIFLVTAETAFGAAIGYDWLYESLSEGERERVARAIFEKAIQPGLEQFAVPSHPYWTTTAMNWNLVCNGALMVAALSVLEADARAAQLFSLCRESVSIGLSVYRPDGGWVEGPGYWHYATQYAIYLLDSLSTALGTDLGLDASPGFSKTGLFRLHVAGPSGKLFNFADGEERHSGGYWLFWLAKRYRHPVDAWIEQHVEKVHPMDLLWFDDERRDPYLFPTAQWFRAAGVVMLRGSWRDPDTTYLGIKGGANDACEHGHYDLGSFVLDANGARWAKDLGPDDYNLPGYFTPEMRSRYYRTSTIGHNTIIINGECQPPRARAIITKQRLAGNAPFVVMDLSSAYPSAVSALRGFALIDGRHVLIADEIIPKASLRAIDWQMHTEAHTTLDNTIATLTYPALNDDAVPRKFYLRIIDPYPAAWTLGVAAPSEPRGQNPNTGVAKLLLRLEQVTEPARLVVLLSPEAGACAAAELPLALQPVSDWA